VAGLVVSAVAGGTDRGAPDVELGVVEAVVPPDRGAAVAAAAAVAPVEVELALSSEPEQAARPVPITTIAAAVHRATARVHAFRFMSSPLVSADSIGAARAQ
jgi:hypothetical protein